MVKYDVDDLRRLSQLLDEVLELPESARASWLAGLGGQDASLRGALAEMLDSDDSTGAGSLLERPPAFAPPEGAEAASAFGPGEAIGPYRLLKPIGHGGMGEVWLAERADGQLKRRVALKLPVLGLRRSVLVQRFARERDILGALVHPHIARLYDAGLAEDGQPFLALEYVEGTPITQAADAMKLDARGRVALLRQVMEAVQYAHANLVIHRDLKPGNVLVTAEGRAILLDFGIAKLVEDTSPAHETELTRLGGRALTLHYAAPEQVGGAPISTAVDVWALGVLLYELLTGARPFEGKHRVAIEQAVVSRDPVRPSQRRTGALAGVSKGLAADLDTIVLKALRKDPARRFATVNEFSADLERWLHGKPVEAQPDTAWYRTRRFVSRHRVGVAAAGAAAAAIVGIASVAVVFALEAREESARALAARDFMIDMFLQTDPDAARGKEVTARQLLVQGYRNVVGGMRAQPQLQAELLMGIGDALESMEDAASADKAYAQAALAYARIGMRREAAGATLDRAGMRFHHLWETSSAAPLLEESARTHPAPAADDEFAARHALYRAIAAGTGGDLAEERRWYERAVPPADRTFRDNTNRSVMAVRALANLEAKFGASRSGSARLDALLARLTKDPKARPGSIVGVLDDLANMEFAAGRFQAALDRYDEEAAFCRRSSDLHGSQCVYTQFQRARTLMLLGWHERALETVPALLSPSRVSEGSSRIAAQFSLMAYHVLAANRQADRHPALQVSLRALADSIDEKGDAWMEKFLFLLAQARLSLEEGRASEAHAAAARAHALAASRAADLRPFFFAFVIEAMAAHAMGQSERALELLERAHAAQVELSGANHPMAQLVSVHRAGPLGDLGQRDKALALLDHAIPILREALGPEAPNFRKIRALREELATTGPGGARRTRKAEVLM